MGIAISSFSLSSSFREDIPTWEAPERTAWTPAVEPPPWMKIFFHRMLRHELFSQRLGKRLDGSGPHHGDPHLPPLASGQEDLEEAKGPRKKNLHQPSGFHFCFIRILR